MSAASEFTPDEIQAAVSGKQFYTWEQIAANSKLWVALLWRSMWTRGKGYMRRSTRHTGKDGDRRKDKLEGPLAGVAKAFRSYAGRYASPKIRVTDKSRRRTKNLQHVYEVQI